MKRERWEKHPKYPIIVSSNGAVKNMDGRILVQRNWGKYLSVHIKRRFGASTGAYVHRLVLETYIGPCPKGMEAAHLDGKKTNNNANNLRWVTRVENARHRVAHGTAPIGSNNPMAKVTEKKVIQMRKQKTKSVRELMEKYNISKRCVCGILRGETWTHVLPSRAAFYPFKDHL